ncbi:MAG: Omp28-related outer membrane protein [bacterium]|nr:Omp28-related outer membrane protein [bacterium]
MKKLLFILIPFTATCFIACDKITNPIVKRDVVIGTQFVEKNNSDVSNFKKSLLEDYTGQTCPNCPDAAQTATALAEQYPKNLVVIAVHAGSFADLALPTFTNDFRTTAGDAWKNNFNIIAFPSGMVNRKVYPGSSSVLLLRTKWSGAVAQSTTEPFVVKLDVNTRYDTVVRSLNATIKASFKTAFSANIELISLLVEDGIIGMQDYHGIDVPDYVFDHVALGTIPDAEIWGKRLKTAPITAQTDTTLSFSNFPVMTMKKGRPVNDKEVYLVVIAFNSATKEVLQAEKIKIR